ncbi:MAG: hypothetical protein NTU44_04535 [Bacteroidetes bacterium]|nr:hypothetical protein [Bacteroidota bacterium]
MKTKIKILALFLILFIGTGIIPQRATAQQESVTFQVFYDALSPFGTWIANADLGYVWLPNLAPGFTPYATNGCWVYTDMGWTWSSDYSWGWAPFHYGRWYTDVIYGPMWVPGEEWGPGWVTWRKSEDYYAWAPIGPGISHKVAYGSGYVASFNPYTIVKDKYMGRPDMDNYYVKNTRKPKLIYNSTVIINTREDKVNNITYNAGPDRIEIEKLTGKPISPVIITDRNKPGQLLSHNQFEIYKPQVQKNNSVIVRPSPVILEDLNNMITTKERNAGRH